jgi:hypothetical protein
MTKEIEIDRQLITRRWTPSPPAVDPPSKPASAPWSTAWPPRTLPGATDASTASSPASASLHHLEHPPPGRRGGRAALRGAQDTDLRPVQPGRSAPYPGGVNGGTDLGQFSTGAGPGDPGLRRVPPRHHHPRWLYAFFAIEHATRRVHILAVTGPPHLSLASPSWPATALVVARAVEATAARGPAIPRPEHGRTPKATAPTYPPRTERRGSVGEVPVPLPRPSPRGRRLPPAGSRAGRQLFRPGCARCWRTVGTEEVRDQAGRVTTATGMPDVSDCITGWARW